VNFRHHGGQEDCLAWLDCWGGRAEWRESWLDRPRISPKKLYIYLFFWVRTIREGGIHRCVPEGSGWKPALPLRL